MLKYIMCKSVLVGVSLFLFIASGNAYSATYYTATTGSDSNSCAQATSKATPKQTINAGMGCLSAGDTLYIRGGTYAETLDNCVGTSFPSGTSWNNPVTIAGYPGESTTIRSPSGSTFVLDSQCGGMQYIIFDNLILDGSNVSNTVAKLAGNHIRIQNSEIFGSSTEMGILTGALYIEMLNLNIHHNAQYGIYNTAQNSIMDHLDLHDNGGVGLHLYADAGNVNNNTLRNSRIHDNGFNQRQCYGGCKQPGVILSSGVGNVMYNNLIYHNGTDGVLVTWGGDTTGIYNNTIYNNAGACVTVANSTATTIRNNICFNNSGGDNIQDTTGSVSVGNNLLNGTNPLFVDTAAADFHLQTNSPVIDGEVAISLVSTDFAGTSRPQGNGYDIGAYEYVGNQLAAPHLKILP